MAKRCEIIGCVGLFDFFELYGFGLLHQVDGFAGDGGGQTEAGGAVFGFGEADVDVGNIFGAGELVNTRYFGGHIFTAEGCVVNCVITKFLVGLYLFGLIYLGLCDRWAERQQRGQDYIFHHLNLVEKAVYLMAWQIISIGLCSPEYPWGHLILRGYFRETGLLPVYVVIIRDKPYVPLRRHCPMHGNHLYPTSLALPFQSVLH